jgi:hypothetical protein
VVACWVLLVLRAAGCGLWAVGCAAVTPPGGRPTAAWVVQGPVEAVVPPQCYRALHSVGVRNGAALESPRLRSLRRGDEVVVTERCAAGDTWRVHCAAGGAGAGGWLSLSSQRGRTLLEPVAPQDGAAPTGSGGGGGGGGERDAGGGAGGGGAPPPPPLPDGWESAISRSTGEVYYVNQITGESTYDSPAAAATAETGLGTPSMLGSGAEPGPTVLHWTSTIDSSDPHCEHAWECQSRAAAVCISQTTACADEATALPACAGSAPPSGAEDFVDAHHTAMATGTRLPSAPGADVDSPPPPPPPSDEDELYPPPPPLSADSEGGRGGGARPINTSSPSGGAQAPVKRGDSSWGLWLEKKSPSAMKGWQRRWFVIRPHGELRYYSDVLKETTSAPKKASQKLLLSECVTPVQTALCPTPFGR